MHASIHAHTHVSIHAHTHVDLLHPQAQKNTVGMLAEPVRVLLLLTH